MGIPKRRRSHPCGPCPPGASIRASTTSRAPQPMSIDRFPRWASCHEGAGQQPALTGRRSDRPAGGMVHQMAPHDQAWCSPQHRISATSSLRVAVGVPTRRCGADEGGRERLVRVPSSGLGSLEQDGMTRAEISCAITLVRKCLASNYQDRKHPARRIERCDRHRESRNSPIA